ncbi:acetyltransferase [Streptomyces viridochromogenes]|uniref:Acetyltransferase n=1 Tax=Streptomyces viridochromogenes TaxID=1938 RepID=A0A0J7ZKJ1_STRVR|nr:GNAT family N-acetyltransferase [Streptomyces viridochromogenes]KMS76429.1 acetyltransferase [Streptomyces viridochromogenes]KOG23207.1 acetyltransferase [Streptomyces viridochromogenes]KOG27189.1 acetyltransferase [Streptomyces viridochromogenes]
MSVDIRVFKGPELLAHTTDLYSVYVDAFCAPPWNEDTERAADFTDRLPRDVRRPGFTAVIAVEGGVMLGFATAWTTLAPFPTDRCYPQVAAGLGPDRTGAWLVGARETDQLAVRARARGTGLAGELLEAVIADAPEGRAWLLTSVRSRQAMSFYRRQGWVRATHPSPDGQGIVVFLGPHHPARSRAGQRVWAPGQDPARTTGRQQVRLT